MNITEILTDVEYDELCETIEMKEGDNYKGLLYTPAQLKIIGTFIAEAIKEKVEREKIAQLIKTTPYKSETIQITQLNTHIEP